MFVLDAKPKEGIADFNGEFAISNLLNGESIIFNKIGRAYM